MHEKFNPYDLDSVGELAERESGDREKLESEAHAEVDRRIQRIKNLYGHVNPYDLDQIGHIFEPLNRLHSPNH